MSISSRQQKSSVLCGKVETTCDELSLARWSKFARICKRKVVEIDQEQHFISMILRRQEAGIPHYGRCYHESFHHRSRLKEVHTSIEVAEGSTRFRWSGGICMVAGFSLTPTIFMETLFVSVESSFGCHGSFHLFPEKVRHGSVH